MDLADIRKKARIESAAVEDQDLKGRSADAEPSAGSLLPAEIESIETASGLQQFFPGREFASEEDYIQGLSGRDQNANIEADRWLTFMLGQEEYALSLEVVLELIKPRFLTDLPKVPDYVRGILSLRGAVVPVIDLRRRLKLGPGGEDGFRRIIVCSGPEQSIGLLVDRIIQVVRMPRDAIEAAPLVLSEVEKDFVAAIGRTQGRMLILLNPEEVLKI